MRDLEDSSHLKDKNNKVNMSQRFVLVIRNILGDSRKYQLPLTMGSVEF